MRNDMVKLHLIVQQMFTAMLTGVVIAPHHADLCLEGNVSTSSPKLDCFCDAFRTEDDRADVPEHRTLHLGDLFWNVHWVVGFPKLRDLFLEHCLLVLTHVSRMAVNSRLKRPLHLVIYVNGSLPGQLSFLAMAGQLHGSEIAARIRFIIVGVEVLDAFFEFLSVLRCKWFAVAYFSSRQTLLGVFVMALRLG